MKSRVLSWIVVSFILGLTVMILSFCETKQTNGRVNRGCVNIDQLYLEDSVYYLEGELFNGCFKVIQDHKLRFLSKIRNGKMNGKSQQYFSDGYYIEGNFINNIRRGEFKTFFPNGSLKKSEYFNAKGQLEGYSKEYFDTGQLKSCFLYKDGMRNGKFEEYRETGELETEGMCVDNNFTDTIYSYFRNGTVKDLSVFRKGLGEGLSVIYSDTSQVYFMWGYMKNGQSIGRWYYKLDPDDCFIRDYKRPHDYTDTHCLCSDLVIPPLK